MLHLVKPAPVHKARDGCMVSPLKGGGNQMLVLQSGNLRRRKKNETKSFVDARQSNFLKEKTHPINHQPGGFRVVCAEFNGSITGKNDFYER